MRGNRGGMGRCRFGREPLGRVNRCLDKQEFVCGIEKALLLTTRASFQRPDPHQHCEASSLDNGSNTAQKWWHTKHQAIIRKRSPRFNEKRTFGDEARRSGVKAAVSAETPNPSFAILFITAGPNVRINHPNSFRMFVATIPGHRALETIPKCLNRSDNSVESKRTANLEVE